MWWAHDDRRSRNFIKECVKELKNDKSIIGATCPFSIETDNTKIISYSLYGNK